MSERSKNILLVFLIGAISIVVIVSTITFESEDNRVERLGASIKCPVCQGESIANSPASMATDMMALVQARVDEGATDEEIVDELLGSFTGAVLLDPPASGATLLLWIAPFAALAVGIGVIWWWRKHPGPAEDDRAIRPTGARKGRLVSGLILGGGFVLVVVVAGAFLQDRAGTTSGAAEVGVGNLEDVSNETMEAVIAANLENPQINGMRLALAERYFTSGDYPSAFPHYLSVAESEIALNVEISTALIRLGWMAYDGNGEVETALTLFDQALEFTPDSSIALYLKGQILWCGAGDTAGAINMFETVLQLPDVSADTQNLVQQDMDLAAAGGPCP